MSDFLYWLSTTSCLAFVLCYQMRVFGESFKSRTTGDISSFFSLHEVTKKHQIAVLGVLTSIPLSFIFFIIAYYMPTFGKALIKYVLNASFEAIALTPNPGQRVISEIPVELYPIIILLAAFLLFGAQLSFLFRKIEQAVLYLFAIRSKTNELANRAATELLTRYEYDVIVEMLNANRVHKVPLAEEFEEERDSAKLAFQILHLSKQEVKDSGLNDAIYSALDENLRTVLVNAGIITRPTETRSTSGNISPIHAFTAILVFIIACILYLVICPLCKGLAEEFGISWPGVDNYGYLVGNIIQVTMTTIIPCMIGVAIFRARTNSRGETWLQSVFITCASVITVSLAINLIFTLKDRLSVLTGYAKGTKVLMEFPELIFIVTHSLIPFSAVLLLLLLSHRGKNVFTALQLVAAVAAIAIGHYVSQWLYEYSANLSWALYWHQALLASVLGITVVLTYLVFRSPQNRFRAVASNTIKLQT